MGSVLSTAPLFKVTEDRAAAKAAAAGGKTSSDHCGGWRCCPPGRHEACVLCAGWGHLQGAGTGACCGDRAVLCRPVASAPAITAPLLQRSLNCNHTYSEEPNMFRTALGESTASLDSTVRSGLSRCPRLSQGHSGVGGGPALGANAGPSGVPSCSRGRVAAHVLRESFVAANLPEPRGATLAHAKGAR